jgi:hypothetical protein
MIMEKVEDAVKQHNKKMTWLSEEENRENRSVPYLHLQVKGLVCFVIAIRCRFYQCCGATLMLCGL